MGEISPEKLEAMQNIAEVEAPVERTQEPTPEKPEARLNEDIDYVETAKGSRYRYLADGRTQRFKTVEGKEYEPQDALVYVPDFEWVKANAPKDLLPKLGADESSYMYKLLTYIEGGEKFAHIVDATGKKLETNEEIARMQGQIFLGFGFKDKGISFMIPVSRKPIVGWSTYDTRTYEKEGQSMRERHLGNKVLKIVKK